MFFYLKKFLSFFFEPISIIILIFLLALYFLYKKEANLKKVKWILISGIMLLLIFSSPSFGYLLIKPLENNFPAHKDFDPENKFRYILVLGSGHSTNEELPPNSRMGQQGLSRVIEGIRLSRLYPETKIIFSGYGGNARESFARMAANVALDLGVEKERILLSEDAKDTIEESQKALPIIGSEPFLLVSSAAHLPRANGIFVKLGMKPTPAPTDFLVTTSWRLEFPSPDGLYKTQRGIYELCGITWAWLTGRY